MICKGLNEMQKKAVLTTEGAVLVLAGAGSGKTSVLTRRIAYLIEEKGIPPYRILALTFTNKAAAEMRERTEALVSGGTSGIVISTFHSMCARFLRSGAEKIGYDANFTIYDTTSVQSILKKLIKDKMLDATMFSLRSVTAAISAAKNADGDPHEYIEDTCGLRAEVINELFDAYNARLKAENAMDFDDLLLNMLRLLRESAETREYYQNRFQYVMVDEYQDTNRIQYELTKLLCGGWNNLFVVGDDDQSIYGWRGADIRNILDFERDFKGATVIKLEQNYRSHNGILKVANCVIAHNEGRHGKVLWSAAEEGPKPIEHTAASGRVEAEYIARTINQLVAEGAKYTDFAVLYRINSLARLIEEKLRVYGVPYKVWGGMSFYDRKEIKDLLAYLTLIVNPSSDTAFLRAVAVPKRGIGAVSITKLYDTARELGQPMFAIAKRAEEFFGKSPFSQKTMAFCALIDEFEELSRELPPSELIDELYKKSGYEVMLKTSGDLNAEAREEIVGELINSAHDYEQHCADEEPSLEGYLESMALISSMDLDEASEKVTLMTLHSAKGLEFETVFLAGMEETIFPNAKAESENRLDEERRLCYVGITRAKRMLYLLHSRKRTIFGNQEAFNLPSRFLAEIDPELLIQEGDAPKAPILDLQPTKKRYVPQETPAEHVFASKATEKLTSFAKGVRVEHPMLGEGVITEILGAGDSAIGVIAFERDGVSKKMFLSKAPLKIV